MSLISERGTMKESKLSERDVARFLSKVKKTSSCWTWGGTILTGGYGYFHVGGKLRRAHRVSWEIENGVIGGALCVLHRCDNPPCVRVDHLFLGTRAQNSKDMISKQRQTLGEKNPNSRLTERQVVVIRALYRKTCANRGNGKILANRFGVTNAAINVIVKRKAWRHV